MSPTFLKTLKILKETIPFFTVLTDYVHFHCMDHLEIWGMSVLFPREHGWHCSIARMNLVCLSGFSVVSWEHRYAVQRYALH